MIDFSKETIDSLHEKLVKNQVTAVELVEQVYHNIDISDYRIKAWLALDQTNAIQKAKQIDEEGIKEGETLKGIPYAAKDNILTEGLLTTASSKMLADYVPTYSATLLEKLEDAGMILIGKTNLDEFAMGDDSTTSYYKVTINPWDEEATPGGSSGGSAAAVSSGQIPVALGTDTGGSIRQPAGFQNLVGMKPTYGLVSRYGVIPSAPSLDTIGPLTRTVKSNAQVLQAMAGYDENDATSYGEAVPNFTKNIDGGVSGLVIGLVEEYEDDTIEPVIQKTLEETAKFFEEQGVKIKRVSLPHILYANATYDMINNAEGSESLARYDGINFGLIPKETYNSEDEVIIKARTLGFGKEVKRRVINGMRITADEQEKSHYDQATKVRNLIKEDYEKAFTEVDIILTPTVQSGAPKQSDDSPRFIEDVIDQSVNIAGLPGLSIPAGFVEGMPFGLQFIGEQLSEAILYRAAYAFEQSNDFINEKPAINVDIFD